MAYNNNNFRGTGQSPRGGQSPVYYLGGRVHNGHGNRTKKMVQVKIGWVIADFLGFSSAFLGWINNLDNVKSAVLFVLGAIYMSARTYFYIRKGMHEIRKQDWEDEDRKKKSA